MVIAGMPSEIGIFESVDEATSSGSIPTARKAAVAFCVIVMVASIVYAAGAESMLTFFPLFGMSLGLAENVTLWLLTVVGLGGMILVLPISWLADHVDRMGLMALCVFLTMVCLFLMPWLIQIPYIADVYAFIFGGVEGMVYALGVILVGQHFRGAMLAAATTMFTACWGAGTMLGPLLVGIGMDWFGADCVRPPACMEGHTSNRWRRNPGPRRSPAICAAFVDSSVRWIVPSSESLLGRRNLAQVYRARGHPESRGSPIPCDC